MPEYLQTIYYEPPIREVRERVYDFVVDAPPRSYLERESYYDLPAH